LNIIEHFRLLGCSIANKIEKVVGLKHMTKEAFIVQNEREDTHGFDEINETMVAIFDGEIMSIMLHDSMSMDQANEYEIVFGFPTSIMDLFKAIMFFLI
jgi:adenylate kinase family enzyme